MTNNENFKPIISKELQSYVLSSKVKEVFFDIEGRHYFNVHKLRAKKDDTDENNWKLYGSGLFSHQQIIPGIHNVDKKKETVCKGNPETLIVYSMTAEEIANSDAKTTGIGVVADVSNLSPAQKALMAEEIFGKDVMAIIDGLKNGTLSIVQKEEEDPIV